VASGETSLADLIAADPLYPYNHKLLIEGYSYGTGFSAGDKIYIGADLFAEKLMKRVPLFDFLHNIAEDDYERFTTDFDIPDSYGITYAATVFLVKIDGDDTDFADERFRIEFKSVDERFSYLRLRADFETDVNNLTPVLSSYKLKVR